MTLQEVLTSVSGKTVSGDDHLSREIHLGFASDLMSEVLTLLDDGILLITGLSNIQSIRTAEMSDIMQILFVRGKMPTPKMIELAEENGIVLMTTPYSMFKSSYLLYKNGLKPVY
ncbi:MAG: DRTGG domain-containing protein [Spirochaetales bacterium]|jgi:predicted transcriptional regulator|nr:DRTGG domain-containing protein [Spirochaetales bacterium]